MIVDPHYTGKDDLKPILSKGWVGWKTLVRKGFVTLRLLMVCVKSNICVAPEAVSK